MKRRTVAVAIAAIALPVSMVGVMPAVSAAPGTAATSSGDAQLVAMATSAASYSGLKADVQRAGGRVVREMPEIQTMVVRGPQAVKNQLRASRNASGVVADRVVEVTPPEDMASGGPQKRVQKVNLSNGPAPTPDPAYSLPGLMWNQQRIRMTDAWQVSAGSAAVSVGVADTGLDFTHSELAPRITSVVDFTVTESPNICKTYYGASDADMAALYGGPVTTDWNGHGSWIGGNIAAALDGAGVNGIAPKVGLVALKISGWCGSAYDSTILDAFIYAADHGIDVVSLSFGGYTDRSDPEQEAIYQLYIKTVRYAKQKGTTIVASAGNEHLRIGAGGKVISHGPLTAPGSAFTDYYGLYETPGGIPGVVDVSSTGNVTAGSSPSCTPASQNNSNATCKPASDAHQPFGPGKQDQLAYYSNYGPRIDVAAPGGARKFNLPVWDRGGTPGFPVTTADGFTAWETFSTTSNWSLQIPCYVFTGGGFPANQCYSTIQGTSMATPHVSAAIALIASAYPQLRHKPNELVVRMQSTARWYTGNKTPPLSATDLSPADLTGVPCPTGYCHLGGKPIPNHEAYGVGIVDVGEALLRPHWD